MPISDAFLHESPALSVTNTRSSAAESVPLAPGATRTVRSVVLIEAGTLGLKRNIVVATAADAQAAFHVADTRVMGGAASPPR